MNMKRRELLLTAAVLFMLLVMPSPGHGGLNPWDWKYGLTQEQQIIIRDCVLEGRAQVKALSAVGRPKEAAELEGILKNLEGRTYSRTNNPSVAGQAPTPTSTPASVCGRSTSTKASSSCQAIPAVR